MNRKVSKKSQRPQLSAERIAAVALALVDTDGLEALSFRSLAKKLACEAMSLYHYYPSRAHLLDAMANICISEIEFAPVDGDWRERLRSSARNYRRMALRHPGFFQFLSIYRLNSHQGLHFLNQVLKCFEDAGLRVEARARMFRVFGYFLTGACLDEALGYAKGPSAANPVPPDEARQLYPAIMVVGPYFAKSEQERTFEAGLAIMMAEVERQVASNASP
jgi:AcrR family transcriptional regulator